MQAVTLTVRGEYWDSQIYKGRLLLFGMDGSLTELDWPRTVASLLTGKAFHFAGECAFANNQYLYDESWQRAIASPDIEGLLKNQFEQLTREHWEIPLERSTRYDWPGHYLHQDSQFYKDSLFSVSKSGVEMITLARLFKRRSTAVRFDRLNDFPAIGLDISYDTLALAGGEDGLFRLGIKGEDDDGSLNRVSADSSQKCSWMSYNIYNSSYSAGSGLMRFEPTRQRRGSSSDAFVFREKIDEQSLFRANGTGHSWGRFDTCCLYSGQRIFVTRYKNQTKKASYKTTQLPPIQVDHWKGEFVSADIAPFGVIVEMDECLIVVRSDGQVETLRGEPVSWRIFPKSHNYENQLHIVYDDRVEIKCYVHDYFVDDNAKIAGFSPYRVRNRFQFMRR